MQSNLLIHSNHIIEIANINYELIISKSQNGILYNLFQSRNLQRTG